MMAVKRGCQLEEEVIEIPERGLDLTKGSHHEVRLANGIFMSVS